METLLHSTLAATENAGLSGLLRDFFVWQKDKGKIDETIDVFLALTAFSRLQQGEDSERVREAVQSVIRQWIHFRPIRPDECIRVSELAAIETNEQVIPEQSREYWYRRLQGGSLLAELGGGGEGELARFLGGIFFQVTAGNPRNFGELTHNRRFDHDPADGDTVHFYSVSTERSYRDFDFQLGAQLVLAAKRYIQERWPHIGRFQTFSPLAIDRYVLAYLEKPESLAAPRGLLLEALSLEEKLTLVDRVYEIHHRLRRERERAAGQRLAAFGGYLKGRFDSLYTRVARQRRAESLFREALAVALRRFSNRELPAAERAAWFSDSVVRRSLRQAFHVLAPWMIRERDRQGRFFDPVQNFHCKNGAVPGEVMLFAATERNRQPIWNYTAGSLSCIRYLYPATEEERLENARRYREERRSTRGESNER